jgi:hypothetical protein
MLFGDLFCAMSGTYDLKSAVVIRLPLIFLLGYLSIG